MVNGQLIVITNEKSAWEVLEKLLKGTLKVNELDLANSKWDWARFNVNYRGPYFEQALTSSSMQGLVDYQRSLYRSISLLLNGSPNINHLSENEKEKFELVFKIEKGSSNASTGAEEWMPTFLREAIKKMTSKEITICIIVFALLYFGTQNYNSYLERNVDLARIEAQGKRDAELIDVIRQLSPQSTPETKILNKAVNSYPSVNKIKDEVDEAYNSIIKNTSGVTQLSIQGHVLSENAIQYLNKGTRRKSEFVTITDLFTVSSVDTRAQDGFNIRFESLDGTIDVVSNISDLLEITKYRRIIEKSTFSKNPIRVTMTVKKIGENYTDATVLKLVTPRNK